MDWFSSLQETLTVFVSWTTTIFLWIALLILTPWLAVFLYDFLLYLWRAILYEMPFIGGRARGRDPPQAPTFTERPGGSPRILPIPITSALDTATPEILYLSGTDVGELRHRHNTGEHNSVG